MSRINLIISVTIFSILLSVTSLIKNQTRVIEKNIRKIETKISNIEKDLHETELDFFYLSSPNYLSEKIKEIAFIEYTPIFLILLFLAENNNVNLFVLNVLSIIFTVSRFLHGFYFGFLNSYIAPEKFKETKKNSLFFICRVGPTLLTIFSLLVIAIINFKSL